MKKHLNIIIHGKVQGVFFRSSAKEKAEELGIKGYIRNMEDGTVLIEAEADKEVLSEFLNWCENGPDKAEVEKIDKFQKGLQHYDNFQVVNGV